jgi:hypothetical protein
VSEAVLAPRARDRAATRAAASVEPLLTATAPVGFFDYLRVPYELAGTGSATAAGLPLVEVRGRTGKSVQWPAWAPGSGRPAEYRLDGIPVFGRVLHDDAADLEERGWTRVRPIADARGAAVASIWRDARGSLLLPFDPGELIESYWSERYREVGARRRARLLGVARRAYYRLRPLVPRSLQLRLRRVLQPAQARARAPRESALRDLFALLFDVFGEAAGEPLPWIAPWPAGHAWALVLTHDVETETGYRNLHLLRDVEAARGRRSAWNLVAKRYRVEDADVEALRRDGFEIGVHGLYHDGRDLESLRTLRRRLPAMREHGRRWGATGFRAPATLREWSLMPLLGFDHDSSSPDCDPYEPKPGGCRSWLPFFNEGLVELPITLPQDHTVFTVLGRTDVSLWHEKTQRIRDYGGMALLITHPDYMLERERLDLYAGFLDAFGTDEGVWCALPSEVSAWWRRRAASTLVAVPGGWRVDGPAAADAAVASGAPGGPA